MSKKDIVSVSELNEAIKSIFVSQMSTTVKVTGEISNIKISNNNTFLTLKDENASISVISWGTKFDKLKNGDDVVVVGKITCYPKQGTYNITTHKIERIGVGNLHEKYEKSKLSFENKGYFSSKKTFPTKINRIAILTSTEGAALQDVMYVLKSNSFSGEILIKNCIVQGTQCPQSIEDGINFFDKIHEENKIDVLLITRGGGSFEDLMGYSSKEAVKSIHKSDIFIISAVGHEIDNMLSDFAADCRAPTPSVAAEMISQSQKDIYDKLSKYSDKLSKIHVVMSSKMNGYEERLKYFKKTLHSLSPITFINTELSRIDNNKKLLNSKLKDNIDYLELELERLKNKNETYNISKTMENGFVAILDEDNQLINSISILKEKIKCKENLKIILADGEYKLSRLYK